MSQIDERRDSDARPEVVVESTPAPREDIVPFDYSVSQAERAAQNGHPPRVLWITGLSASGKSTLANHVDAALVARGVHSYVLDGDSLRAGLSADLGFTPEDRRENVRRVAEVAHLMYDAGLVVIVALVSPFRSDRDLARSLFPAGDFVEVYVNTPVEVCAERDPKGLYAKAAAGNLSTMTGRGQAYEPPLNAEVVVDGVSDVAASAAKVIEVALTTVPPLR